MSPVGDMKILGDTREPLVISCEQCLTTLGLVVGDVEAPYNGTHLCLGCVERLGKWVKHIKREVKRDPRH